MFRRLFLSLLLTATLSTAFAQTAAGPSGRGNIGRAARNPLGPVRNEQFGTTYVRLGSANDEGLLYEPKDPGAKARVAIVYEHTSDNNFNADIGPELAARGYRVLMINHHGSRDHIAQFAASISYGIRYLRTLPGVQRVVVCGHSGGGHLIAFYANAAENGPAAATYPGLLYPCDPSLLTGLEKPDGVVLLDPTMGAFHATSAVDPAFDGKVRQPALDMFTAANSYDAANERANYSADFAARFHAAQSARGNQLIDHALARLKAIEAGTGGFTDDEPLVIPAASDSPLGTRLYHADVKFLAHTKKPHLLLKADGTRAEVIVPSIRPPSAERARKSVGSLGAMTLNTTVRQFLANSALRTTKDFALTADDITGVDWKSSMDSSPGNAEGIKVPTLLVTMTYHYLVVPGEIIFDHLAATDKTYAAIEGAVHNFTPGVPKFGDTQKRLFDFVDEWISKPGRF